MQLIRNAVHEGITLNALHTDKFKASRFSINFILPLVVDEIPYYAILPKILKHGCQSYPSMTAIARKLDLLYATDVGYAVSTIGSQMIFTVDAEFLADRYVPKGTQLAEEVFGLLFDILSRPLLTADGRSFIPSVIEQEKENLLHDIRATVNNKARYALRQTRLIMCENEPYKYGMLPTEVDMEGFDASRILPCFKKLLHTSRVEYFYVGNESNDRILALSAIISDFLGARTLPSVTEIRITEAKEQKEVTEILATTQAQLCIGYRTGIFPRDDLAFAYSMFASILSASPVSKLFMNVREKRSLCYGCHMIADIDSGIAIIIAGIAKEKKEEALAAIQEEIDNMRRGNISDEELAYARSSIRDSYRSVFDSPQSIEHLYMRFIVRGYMKTVDEIIANAERTKREDLMRIAERMQRDTIFFLANNSDNASAEDEDSETEDDE